MLALVLAATTAILWQDPGSVASADLSTVSVQPKPPYTFLREDLSGTSPKVYVRDASGNEWRVQGGMDAKPEAFITRFVKALGYYAETNVYSAEGRILKVPQLQRASGFIKPDGSYTWAAFERVDKQAKFVGSWSWVDSPFNGTPELKGLKVLVMLFSNWDNKDIRETNKGSNTSVMEFADGRQVYFVNDWGQSLGTWGRFIGRANWKCSAYEKQTSDFVKGVRDGYVRFGFGGEHTGDFKDDIKVEDVRWLLQYLAKIEDSQLRKGLVAAGATPEEQDCYVRSIRARIDQLRQVTVQ